jgi:hypothetical protein
MIPTNVPSWQASPLISGQLRSSICGAQILQVTFGCSQNPAAYSKLANHCCNPLITFIYNDSLELSKLLILPISVRGTELPDSPILSTSTNGESWFNLLILLNSGDSSESGLQEQYSDSPKLADSPSLKVPTKFVATCTLGIQWGGKHSFAAIQQVTGKEKGRTANPTLWDACFFNHQENHNLAAAQDSKVALGNPVTYESFVGQPSGDSLAFLRCSAISFRPQASSTQDENWR